MTHEVIKMSQGDYEIFKLVAKDPWFKTKEIDGGTIQSISLLNKFFNKLQKNIQMNTFLDIRDIYKEFIKNNDKIGFNQFESYFLSKLGEYDINKREYQGWIGWEIKVVNLNNSEFTILNNQYETDSDDSDFIIDAEDDADDDEDDDDDDDDDADDENGDDENDDDEDIDNQVKNDKDNKLNFDIEKDELSELQDDANKILSQK